jgi:molecular chaperone DnaJ
LIGNSSSENPNHEVFLNLIEAIRVLELTVFTGREDLRRQYHQLAHRYHPDKNRDDDAHESFVAVMDAYDFCLNHLPQLYRHFGTTQPDDADAAPHIDVQDDIFEEVFGYSRGGRILGYQEPQSLTLSVAEFALGTEKILRLAAYKPCGACLGVGARKGTSAKICRHCFGQGTIRRRRRAGQVQQVCAQCQGRGRTIVHACASCNGFGRVPELHRQRLTLPVGMTPGEVYALECFDLKTNTPAQVFITPQQAPDRVFKIEKFDLLCDYRHESGDETREVTAEVNTPFGRVGFRIPANFVSGNVLRVPGAGLFKDAAKSTRGDLKLVIIRKRSPWLIRRFKKLFSRR